MVQRSGVDLKIFYTTEDFRYKGKVCDGIPFLCSDDMEFIQVVNDFLLWLALENAHSSSPLTWKSYAETLFDFFSWLDTNDFAWDAFPKKDSYGEEISNLAMYRNWSSDLVHLETGTSQIQASTIHKRLTHIMAFYQWALSRGRIAATPWEQSIQLVSIPEKHPTMYRHTHTGRLIVKDNLRPKVKKKLIPLLQLEQCRLLMRACRTQTLQLMTKLMLQTGLRNQECLSFPRKYVFDPSLQDRNTRIPICLSPADMALKGQKPRRIYVSWQLMKDMFDYLNFGEGVNRARNYRAIVGTKSPLVFLTRDGYAFSDKGLNNLYRKLWAPAEGRLPILSFRVTPHMLRHTFATFELYAESQRHNLGAALAWVRDRMGHSSISTTSIYVHCLDMMGEADLNMYQQEIDMLIVKTAYGYRIQEAVAKVILTSQSKGYKRLGGIQLEQPMPHTFTLRK